MTEDELKLLGFIVDSDKEHRAFSSYIDDGRMWELLKLGLIRVYDKINNDIFVKPTPEGLEVRAIAQQEGLSYGTEANEAQ